MTADIEKPNNQSPFTLKEKLRKGYKHFRELQGDPHYIAVGMGIGVFVAVTPTIPFHTILAIAMAFILKGSKPAAAIGVWFSNPLTIPPFYWASYRFGCLILGKSDHIDMADPTISHLLRMGWEITVATLFGGILLGIIPGIAAYFITLKVFKTIRARKYDLT